ncbi:capsid protein precursor pVIII [Crane-associated adenovirus 1]|uniref:Pre-hexon-linking protein VIII n=1 Tax=Crane-associated adenovirus 1 TaxID=2559941 RepID=A0A5H2WTL3_9ADEN|nr:capsid protein precursor pVIII [Crane-associated adenovirus 1]
MFATPTEYVWKYNPLSGIPAGAQQNYGATINWVLPGGRYMQDKINDIQRRTLDPEFTSAITATFEAQSDNQPFANTRESNYIANTILDSGMSRKGLYPFDQSGCQRVQLAGGLCGCVSEGRIQLSGGKTDGKVQMSGGMCRCVPSTINPYVNRPPRWVGAEMTGNGMPNEASLVSNHQKYLLRTDGPSADIDVPGTYTRRQFMELYVPAINNHPFNSSSPLDFPAQYSAIYKGRNQFQDYYWDW